MAYRIELLPLAFDEIDAIVEYIARDSFENAHRWRMRPRRAGYCRPILSQY
jgi:hypothetical protein